MKRLLLASVALLALTGASQAAVIDILTPDPTSSTGNFSATPAAGPFDDQVAFVLTHSATFVIANATNTFANSGNDKILNWQASIFDTVDGIIGNGNDQLLFGPQVAGACFLVPNCQQVGGSGTIDHAGRFYADFTGTAGTTSGYSGNISTFAVPGPVVGALGIPGLIAA